MLTNMKSHAQPGLCATPSMFKIAAASNPDRAKASAVTDHKIDILPAHGKNQEVEHFGYPTHRHQGHAPELQLPPWIEGREV